LYGGTKPYSFYNFAIRPCIADLDGNICESNSIIKSFLNQVFLDVRTVDFSVSHFDSDPAHPFVKGDRFSVSQTIFRRIWMSFNHIEYNSDVGFVFSETQKTFFHAFDSFSSEVDLRDQKTNVTPYTFLWLTLVNSPRKVVYFRNYMKAQNLLANIGGIAKSILLIGSFLNNIISRKLYFEDLINSLFLTNFQTFKAI
jgi:hypothetical protein